jgi:choice-of-anchor C domain-containing protein
MHRAILASALAFLLLGDPGFGVHLRSARSKPVNLLVNGSFEEGRYPGKWRPLNPGSTEIKGWTVTRGQIDYIETNWPALDGKRSIDLHGSPGFGGVAQTFATEKGKTYTVTLFLAGTPETGPKRVAVRAAGADTEFRCDGSKATYQKMGWAMYSWEFKAVADKTTLEIHTLETSDPFRGPVLDHVSVTLDDR